MLNFEMVRNRTLYCTLGKNTVSEWNWAGHIARKTHNKTYGQTTRAMDKWNQKSSRLKLATSGNGSFKMERGRGDLHPAMDTDRLNKKKKKIAQ